MLGSIAMESEASHMLEAALEQMDGIIAGKEGGGTTLQVWCVCVCVCVCV